MAMYDQQQVAVLLRCADANAAQPKSELALFSFAELRFAPLPSTKPVSLTALPAVRTPIQSHAVFSHAGDADLMAVMAPPRGVACVYTAARRIYIFDLLDEEDEEEGDAADEGVDEDENDKENQKQ